jgi:hypothetical protein
MAGENETGATGASAPKDENYEKFQKYQQYELAQQQAFNLNENYVNSVGDLMNASKSMEEIIKGTAGSITETESLKFLDEQATKIQNAFGVGKQRLSEFKTLIADTTPELVKMGFSQEEATQSVIDITKSLGTNASIGKEAVVEISAVSKITGQDVGTITQAFRDVGVSIYDAGDKMKEVVEYARNVGVSVQEVSKGVLGNLEKMNLYNFKDGVNGLARMAASASRLGVDLSHTFEIAEKIYNPEGAIEMAAGLQRLGVTASELLDPLRAMDLARNDPEQLEKAIVGITEKWTYFNEQTQEFDILPGAKSKIREVAKELDIPASELTKMSIKGVEFKKKLEQIKFPSLVGTEDKQTREMIASLSTLSGGTAVIKVKDEQGKEVTKRVEDLLPQEIEQLREQQADQNKSIEELASEQLNVLDSINANIGSLVGKLTLGKASAAPVQRVFDAITKVQTKYTEVATRDVTTEQIRQGVDAFTGDLEKAGLLLAQGDKEGSFSAFKEAFTKMGEFEKSFQKTVQDKFETFMTEYRTELKKTYENQLSPTATQTQAQLIVAELNKQQLTVDKKEIVTKSSVDATITINGTGTLTNMSTTEIESSIKNYLLTPEGKKFLDDLFKIKDGGLRTP